VVRRRARADGLPDFRPDALFAATWCTLMPPTYISAACRVETLNTVKVAGQSTHMRESPNAEDQ
jgi:hypothetical protein